MLVLVVTCTTERCVAVMGISPEVQLLAAQITAAGNGFGNAGAAVRICPEAARASAPNKSHIRGKVGRKKTKNILTRRR